MIESIEPPTNPEEEQALRDYLHEQQPEDIAAYLNQLPTRRDQLALIRALDPADVAIVFFELEDSTLMSDALLSLPEPHAMSIAEEMAIDDAADLVSDMPQDIQGRVLQLFDEEIAEDIANLINYDHESAGGLMTTEFVVVPVYVHAAKAIELIRSFALNAETIYYVYVIDGMNHLVGILSLRELIMAEPETMVGDIMHHRVMSVNVHADQEEVADTMAKYNFLALPVVDDDQHIVGIITIDDIVDVINDEATEDIYRMAGTTEAEDEENASVFTAYKARMPWLIVTILGGLCSGTVLASFSLKLSEVIALSFFIPMLTGIAGNVGTQSSTVTVRSIATGAIEERPIWRTILRESSIGLALGLSVGGMVALIASFWQHNPLIGLVVGATILLNNFTAALMGTVVPLFLRRIKIDPAVASAPFITTVVDILGLVNYTTLATVILRL